MMVDTGEAVFFLESGRYVGRSIVSCWMALTSLQKEEAI